MTRPDGTAGSGRVDRADAYRSMADYAKEVGLLTWTHILEEEVAAALAEKDPAALSLALIRVVIVCDSWLADIEDRDPRRLGDDVHPYHDELHLGGEG